MGHVEDHAVAEAEYFRAGRLGDGASGEGGRCRHGRACTPLTARHLLACHAYACSRSGETWDYACSETCFKVAC